MASEDTNRVVAFKMNGRFNVPEQKQVNPEGRRRTAVVGTASVMTQVDGIMWALQSRPDYVNVVQMDTNIRVLFEHYDSDVSNAYTQGVAQRIEQLVNDNYDWILTGKQTS